ncbi:MAG TPA: alpha/beta hydrolase-fold protein [Gemmataceae bacterium]|nr:alpha/beta hydrolase-fold protein [Gemmataceae bacterium]
MESWVVLAFWMDFVGLGQSPPALFPRMQLERIQRQLHGQIVDLTHNHGRDNRIWSTALGEKRDMYVYLPPNYDPSRKYPLGIFLHGAAQDELFFLQAHVRLFDQAIYEGRMPPMILAAPDGSIHGQASFAIPATFWADSKAGAFERYLMCDVWNYLHENFPIRPEREAHSITGVSMGGGAAVGLAIKYRDRFKTAVGMMPLVNIRYVDCHGKYRTDFDPQCWAMRERFHGAEALGKRRMFTLRFDTLFTPLYGRGEKAICGMSEINPMEIMERENLQNGELNMYIAYGGKDQFNIAAQVESFLYVARQRGIDITVDYDSEGRHDLATGLRMFPRAVAWSAAHTSTAP